MGKGRWRLAGVILLLAVQAALAGFLGFLATVHWDESNRFHLKAGLAYIDVKAAMVRCTTEAVAALADGAVVSFFAAVLLG